MSIFCLSRIGTFAFETRSSRGLFAPVFLYFWLSHEYARRIWAKVTNGIFWEPVPRARIKMGGETRIFDMTVGF